MRVAAAGFAFLGILVEAALRHDVDADVLPRHVLGAARADAVEEAEVGAVLGDPLRSLGPVLDIGHAVLQLPRRFRHKQVGRHPWHVEMTIGRDSAVLHGFSPLYEGSKSTVLLRQRDLLAVMLLRTLHFCRCDMNRVHPWHCCPPELAFAREMS